MRMQLLELHHSPVGYEGALPHQPPAGAIPPAGASNTIPTVDELRAEIAEEESNYARLREELQENRKALQVGRGIPSRKPRVHRCMTLTRSLLRVSVLTRSLLPS